MRKRRSAPQLSGAAKMKRAGKRGVLLGVSQQQHELLKRAAAAELRPLSSFILYHAVEAARITIDPDNQMPNLGREDVA